LRHIFRALVLAAAASVISLGFAPAAQAATLDASEGDLLRVVNEFRASRGLPTLAVSDTLTFAAKWMATDMATKNYFDHTSLDGRSPQQRMADAGYPARSTWTGEDLAAGYTGAREVLQGWIDSPAHYAVLINPEYRAIGIGRAYGAASSYKWYWAANFGGIVDAPTTASAMDLGFHAAFHGKSPDPVLAPGQTAQVVVALQNTGYRGWYQGVPGQEARLGTAGPLDVARPELAAGWIAANRPSATTTTYVGPGQVGWFAFTIRAPQTPGTYTLGVRGVIDGTTWLEDTGVVFTVTVR
jgi:uncharacterized protein YkwD